MAELNALFFSNGSVKEEDDLIWKNVLRTGSLKYTPGPGQRPILKPLNIVKESSTAEDTISLDDIVNNFENNAIEHVTIPTSHSNKVTENTGFVRKLQVQKDEDGEYSLNAAFEFTDPDTKEKVKNGSIANTSVGLHRDYIQKKSGDKFPIVLDHVALTNSPWINGLKPFGFSDEQEEGEISVFTYADDGVDTKFSANMNLNFANTDFSVPVTYTVTSTGDSSIKFADLSQWTPIEKESQKLAENEGDKHPRKEKTKEVEMPKIDGLGDVELSEDAIEAVQNLLQAKDAKIEDLRGQNTEFSEEKRTREVDDRINELKGMGLSEQPGFLKVVRNVLLSDDGENTLNFSDEGKEKTLTFSDVVNELIDALPKKDGQINFGQQLEANNEERPPVDAANETDPEKKYEVAHTFLYGHKPKTKR